MSLQTFPNAPLRLGFWPKAKAFFALTKPRVIELLLIATVPTMILAERGIPDPWLVIATVFGGPETLRIRSEPGPDGASMSKQKSGSTSSRKAFPFEKS